MACGLAQQFAVAMHLRLDVAHRSEPVEQQAGVIVVLEAGETAHAFDHDVLCRLRHGLADLALEGGEVIARLFAALAFGRATECRGFGAGGRQSGLEAAQVCLRRLAFGADRAFEGLDRDRQLAAAGDGAEHHRVDHGAGFLGDRFHVEQDARLCILLGNLEQARVVEAAVAQRHLLVDHVEAAGRGNQQRTVGRAEAVGDTAAGLHEFGGHQHVDVADAGRKRQHRTAHAKLVPGRWIDFDIIGGAAGALRDARDRGRLRRQSEVGRGGHDPVGQHAAAFAAERGDQHRDRALMRGHAVT